MVVLDMDAIQLGDKAMTAADETMKKQDSRIKFLSRALNILVPLAAAIGLAAAFWGVNRRLRLRIPLVSLDGQNLFCLLRRIAESAIGTPRNSGI